MNLKPNKIIGIDPDVEKSGVAYLYTPTKEIEVQCLRFPALLEFLSNYEASKDVVVVMEAGWKNKISNYHGYYGVKVGENIAKKVGRNHQLGCCIVEMCEYWGIPVVEKAPLRKCWRGKDRKITQEEIEQFIPNFPKRSNPEIRDAALLAWDYAGFPIRIKPK